MISTTNGFLRTTEPDDAAALGQLYDVQRPRAALLDGRREPIAPTSTELREILGRKEAALGTFYTVEDSTGNIIAFCSLRGMSQETAFGELTLMPLAESFFQSPLAEDTFQFLYRRAFESLRLHRLLVNCLEDEVALRQFLLDRGFALAGVQREVFFGLGRWHDLHVLTLPAPHMARAAAPADV